MKAHVLPLVLVLLLNLFLITFSSRPDKSYLKFSRLTDSSATYIGSGTGLPRGNFTVNYWVRMDGLDICPFTFWADPFGQYMQIGGQSYASSSASTYATSVDYASAMSSWHQQTLTYDRGRDVVKFYVDGVYQGNGTNGNSKGTATGEELFPHKFGWLGKTDDGLGLEWFQLGNRGPEKTHSFNGAVDDFALYDLVLTAEEVGVKFGEVGGLDPSGEEGLVLYYDFDAVTSDAVIENTAPDTAGNYDLRLGMGDSDIVVFGAGGDESCTASVYTAPVLVCHVGKTCVEGITTGDGTGGNKHPNATASSFTKKCVKGGSAVLDVDTWGYDRDGDHPTVFVTALPVHVELVLEKGEALEDSLKENVVIGSGDLPYELDYLWNSLKYVHKPSDPYNISSVDDLKVKFFDGALWSEEHAVGIDIVKFNEVPMLKAENLTTLVVEEESEVIFPVGFLDYDTDSFTTFVTELPTHGKLVYVNGLGETVELEQFNQYNPHGDNMPLFQYASESTAFSTVYYSLDGKWGDTQILGPPNAGDLYGDSTLSYTTSSRNGGGPNSNPNNNPKQEDYWDADSNHARYGWSEYIEVEFPENLYLSSVEIGENRGCGSIVNLFAKEGGEGGKSLQIFKGGPDKECDADDGQVRNTGSIHMFAPNRVCDTKFAAKKIRMEFDTITVSDWNEFDYIKMEGYSELPLGVIPSTISELKYVPDPNFFGVDTFSLKATDCGFFKDGESEEVEYFVNVTGTHDSPVTSPLLISVNSSSVVLPLSDSISSPDGAELFIAFLNVPEYGQFVAVDQAEGERVLVAANVAILLEGNDFYFELKSSPAEDVLYLVQYRVTESRGLGMMGENELKLSIEGTGNGEIGAGAAIEIILGICGIALIIVVGFGWYSRKRVMEKDMALQTDRLIIEDLQHKLEILQKYSDNEVKMIEEQIMTFRKEMGMVAKEEEERGITPGMDTPTIAARGIEGEASEERSTNKVVDDMKRLLIDAKELQSQQVVGRGSFGQVYKGQYRGMTVAVKTMNTVDQESLERFRAEILLLKDLRHSNIVTLVGACWERDLMALVMEFCEKGMVSEVLVSEGEFFSWDDPMLKIIIDIARAMRYLHGVQYYDVKQKEAVKGIVHRDLKPDNCLMTETYSTKVADFGEARAQDVDHTMTQVGTPMFIAPEIVMGDHYNTKADVFSFALTIISIALKGQEKLLDYLHRHIVKGKKNLAHEKGGRIAPSMGRVSHGLVSKKWRPSGRNLLEIGMPESLVDLCKVCWAPDEQDRPTFAEIQEYLEIDVKRAVMEGSTRKGQDLTLTRGAGGGSKGGRRTSTSGSLALRMSLQTLEGEGGTEEGGGAGGEDDEKNKRIQELERQNRHLIDTIEKYAQVREADKVGGGR
ncbi:hypothetical protein TL16_g12321 [Triparma laevis f. inornata]|uniref:Protein kinase domain-containing protein n=1 Tax=Triparma laevis f. inornata TaxID=1714386 RepID=A0A9W7BPS1_9STRA|nr:hypothetical protein TL16_g12321 [Triparma laevis f. inornata]